MEESLSDRPTPGPSALGTSRWRILQTLRHTPGGRGVQELAEDVGLHVNTVRFHLDRLIEDGEVTRHSEERTQPGRPRLTFTAVTDGAEGRGARSYRLLATILAGFVDTSVPDPVVAATRAGWSWGHRLTRASENGQRTGQSPAVAELVRILDDIGFEPELVDAGTGPQIRVRHCPFREVAEQHPDVACAIHLGLMQGVLAELGAPVTTSALAPFVEPSLCVADLGPVPVGLPEASALARRVPGDERGVDPGRSEPGRAPR